jgi:hypothetical protein
MKNKQLRHSSASKRKKAAMKARCCKLKQCRGEVGYIKKGVDFHTNVIRPLCHARLVVLIAIEIW